MPFLVDGHNLIPHIPGLSLQDLDDEISLIEILRAFATRQRTQVEVYFDRAAPAQAGSRSYGKLKAHFVPQGRTADQAMVARLKRLGRAARNWTVVTSDREILVEARSAGSTVLGSAEFAARLAVQGTGTGPEAGKGEDPDISESEVDYWLGRFRQE